MPEKIDHRSREQASELPFELLPVDDWTDEVVERLRQLRNEPETRRFLITDRWIGADEHQRWFATARSDPKRVVFAVRRSGEVVGLAFLNLSDTPTAAEWGFHLAPSQRGRGLAAVMLEDFLAIAFDRLALNTILGRVLGHNTPSLALHRRLGFSEEGREHRYLERDGVWLDCVHFALTRKRWLASRRPGRDVSTNVAPSVSSIDRLP
jgi:UDP-4-amino-4,6-dideoxy-N-acetyl-beta-L-altrosamine N-acetyltransferase